MPGYLEAAAQAGAIAEQQDLPVLSTYTQLSGPFILALYATETPPQEFLSTVEWKDENAEFRVAHSFGRFTFGLPEDSTTVDPAKAVLILHTGELASFPGLEDKTVQIFGDYAVISGSIPE